MYKIVGASLTFLALLECVASGDPQYELKFVKMENYLPKGESPIEVIQAKAERYNRTLIITNVSVELSEDLCEKAECSIEGFEKMGVEFGKGTINIPPIECCSLMETDYWLYPAMVDVSNLPRNCPVKKNRYDILNFLLDSRKLPEQIPGAEDWRFDIRVSCNGTDIYYVGVWVTFDRSEVRRRQGENSNDDDAPPSDNGPPGEGEDPPEASPSDKGPSKQSGPGR